MTRTQRTRYDDRKRLGLRRRGLQRRNDVSYSATLPGTGTLDNGTVAITEVIAIADLGGLTYVPVANANSAVTFTFKVFDERPLSASAGTIVTLTYTAVDDAPVCEAGDAQSVAEGAASTQTEQAQAMWRVTPSHTLGPLPQERTQSNANSRTELHGIQRARGLHHGHAVGLYGKRSVRNRRHTCDHRISRQRRPNGICRADQTPAEDTVTLDASGSRAIQREPWHTRGQFERHHDVLSSQSSVAQPTFTAPRALAS